MTATNLVDAKLECLNDLTCDMFYRVCNYSRFRKCNNFAKAEYQEPSLCGHILGNSTLYTWSNIYKICYFQQSYYNKNGLMNYGLVFMSLKNRRRNRM